MNCGRIGKKARPLRHDYVARFLMPAGSSSILTREAGEGDHLAKQDGGGGASRAASLAMKEVCRVLRPLHRAFGAVPLPRLHGGG
jgi:hypothetical protein